MEISLAHQFTVAVSSVILGLISGLIYDIVRIARCILGIRYEKALPSGLRSGKGVNKIYESVIIGFTDVAYFIIVSVIVSVFVYFINSGRIRWYIYFFAVIGFIIYYFTVGRIVISLSSIIAYGIRRVFCIFLVCLYEPFKPIIKLPRLLISKSQSLYKSKKKAMMDKALKKNRRVVMEYGKTK